MKSVSRESLQLVTAIHGEGDDGLILLTGTKDYECTHSCCVSICFCWTSHKGVLQNSTVEFSLQSHRQVSMFEK
jgi:hypothetical protein